MNEQRFSRCNTITIITTTITTITTTIMTMID